MRLAYRVAAEVLQVAHALFEVTLILWTLLAPLQWTPYSTYAIVAVGGLMWVNRGACVVTIAERRLRRRAGVPAKTPSMTKRLARWLSLGKWDMSTDEMWGVLYFIGCCAAVRVLATVLWGEWMWLPWPLVWPVGWPFV